MESYLKILQNRKNEIASNPGCCQKICRESNDLLESKVNPDKDENSLEQMNTLELLNCACDIQSKRINAYNSFNSNFDQLLQGRQIEQYPALCERFTIIFNDINKSIRSIIFALESRSLEDCSAILQSMQNIEKEKLLQTAAYHLERMRVEFPLLEAQYGPRIPGYVAVLEEKIRNLEANIMDIIEKLQEIKCDFIDSN